MNKFSLESSLSVICIILFLVFFQSNIALADQSWFTDTHSIWSWQTPGGITYTDLHLEYNASPGEIGNDRTGVYPWVGSWVSSHEKEGTHGIKIVGSFPPSSGITVVQLGASSAFKLKSYYWTLNDKKQGKEILLADYVGYDLQWLIITLVCLTLAGLFLLRKKLERQ